MEAGGSPEHAAGGGSEMSEGIMNMIRPAIAKLDEQVKNTRKSQLLVNNHIEQLKSKITTTMKEEPFPCHLLDPYLQKLAASKDRMARIATKLHHMHERTTAMQKGMSGEAKLESS